MRELRILLIDANEADGEVLRRWLERQFELLHFERIQSLVQLEHQLNENIWDVVLSAYHLPNFSGQEALAYVREKNENLPFILVSDGIGEEVTVEMLKFGANDVVLKNNLNRLPFAIERVMREAEVRESERRAHREAERAMRAREQMLTVVSHDLRNPLGAIQLNAETVKHKLESARTLDEAQQALAYITSIARSSMRMKSLISDVLDKVRIESGSFAAHPTRRSLNDFLQEIGDVFTPLAAEKPVSFELLPLKERVTAHLDFERLYQILSNLIGNAIKFTPQGGRVTLSVSLRAKDIEFQVKDTGAGIDPAHLDKIFEKYWQNQTAPSLGLGLGLSIAKDLVKANGGRIWVESAKGRGATFGFYLPCSWAPEEKRSQAHEPNSRWICLVDDDDDLRDILEENLRHLGYQVTSFATGQQAVESLRSKELSPDLMILDYRLPDMNGGDVMENLRLGPSSENPMPVIFLSAEANISNLASKHQVAAFLSKPLRIRDLSKMIEELV